MVCDIDPKSLGHIYLSFCWPYLKNGCHYREIFYGIFNVIIYQLFYILFFGQFVTNLCPFIGWWHTVQCGLALVVFSVWVVMGTSDSKKQKLFYLGKIPKIHL